jgi:hypothetical protein
MKRWPVSNLKAIKYDHLLRTKTISRSVARNSTFCLNGTGTVLEIGYYSRGEC